MKHYIPGEVFRPHRWGWNQGGLPNLMKATAEKQITEGTSVDVDKGDLDNKVISRIYCERGVKLTEKKSCSQSLCEKTLWTICMNLEVLRMPKPIIKSHLS